MGIIGGRNKKITCFVVVFNSMKKFYYLSSCSTCKRILQELQLSENVILIDIKKDPLTENELAALVSKSGSYEALFSKRAQLYKQRNLKDQNFEEKDFKALLLEHYTFLKRPVLLTPTQIVIGNSAAAVAAMKSALDE